MRQAEVIVRVVEHELLPQPVFTLAQRADPSPDRGDVLPDGEVEAVTVGRRIAPPTAASERRVRLSPHAAPQYPTFPPI